MNINAESHFAIAPADVDFQRSQFDRSHSLTTTFNVGQLIPFYLSEVLPGDTFDVSTNKVVRLQTLISPVMDNLYLDTYYFYVPNRIIWEHWQQFCGESNQAWTPSVEYSIPQVSAPALGSGFGWLPGTLADYLGLPVAPDSSHPFANKFSVNALPFRAYAKICDDWFRDQNVQDPLLIPLGDADTAGSNDIGFDSEPVYGGRLFIANKFHDYFTSCLPSPQKGASVTVPMSGAIPVGTASSDWPSSVLYKFSDNPMLRWLKTSNYVSRPQTISNESSSTPSLGALSTSTDFDRNIIPSNLVAITGDLTGAGASLGVSVSALRFAFQLQRFYERLARGGSRYIEILKSMFGVTSPDARLQRSEYLGGNRVPISVHEVTNNAQSDSGYLGNLGAFSHTTDTNDDFIKSFTEHGYVIGLCVARYDHTYTQGLDRLWTRDTRTSFYWPVFANLSEQAVYKKEIMFTSESTDKDVFGYQEAWAEYRYTPNRCTGEMRPQHPQSLATWNFADDYDSVPTLSESWMAEDKTNVDRTLQVSSSVSNQILLDVYIRDHTSRVMPVYSIPGLVDHN